MKITAKGNSAWLVLTNRNNPEVVVLRTRDIQAVEQGSGGCGSCVICAGHSYLVKENYVSILQALEVNLPTVEMES